MNTLNEGVDIAIITIRDDENKAVLERLDDYEVKTVGHRSYAMGRLRRHDDGDLVIAVVKTPSQGPLSKTSDPEWIALLGIGGQYQRESLRSET